MNDKNRFKEYTAIRLKIIVNNQRGLTLIEIIVSIAILSIIIVPFLGMFIQSTNTNRQSQNILEATNLAQSVTEEVYFTSKNYSFTNGRLKLVEAGYAETAIDPENDYKYIKEQDSYYVEIELINTAYSGNLVKVVVKVYKDESKNKLESQMETILFWE